MASFGLVGGQAELLPLHEASAGHVVARQVDDRVVQLGDVVGASRRRHRGRVVPAWIRAAGSSTVLSADALAAESPAARVVVDSQRRVAWTIRYSQSHSRPMTLGRANALAWATKSARNAARPASSSLAAAVWVGP